VIHFRAGVVRIWVARIIGCERGQVSEPDQLSTPRIDAPPPRWTIESELVPPIVTAFVPAEFVR
jgi:hypothetical protein